VQDCKLLNIGFITSQASKIEISSNPINKVII
jgi:hypothetical protein